MVRGRQNHFGGGGGGEVTQFLFPIFWLFVASISPGVDIRAPHIGLYGDLGPTGRWLGSRPLTLGGKS